MADLRDDDFARAEHAVPKLLRKLVKIDVLEGRTVYAAAFLCGSRRRKNRVFAFDELALGERIVKRAFDIENIGRVFCLQIEQYGLIHRNAEPPFFVQRFDGQAQLLAQRFQLLRAFGKRDGFALRKGKRAFDAFEHVRLVRFVGMQLEAEFPDPDRVQPLFHDVERRLLFRDEQHAFAVRQRVCDHVRDRLAFARAGRSVQNEARARRRKRHGGKLRTVGRQRQQDFFGIAFILFERGNFVLLRPSRKQRGNDFILF